jgi:hypothetical protein
MTFWDRRCCPSSPCRDLLPVKNGEKGAGRNADASLSPSLRGEGKGEGRR